MTHPFSASLFFGARFGRGILASVAFASALAAAPISASADDLAAVTADWKQRYPATKLESISRTPVKGVYEVLVGENIFYVGANTDYLMRGEIFHPQSGKSITADRRAELKLDVKTTFSPSMVSDADAFVIKKGTGARVIHVFSDPQCKFCKQLEGSLDFLKDVTIKIYPVAYLGQASASMASSIWCSTKEKGDKGNQARVDAWRMAMLAGEAPQESAGASCSSPVEKNTSLAKKIGVKGTPTMFANNGKSLDGARPLSMINGWLDEQYKK